jgi:hypothetical protein
VMKNFSRGGGGDDDDDDDCTMESEVGRICSKHGK